MDLLCALLFSCRYRGLDTANDYANEADVGRAIAGAIKDGVCTREELFVQCKLWNTNHRPEHVRLDLQATLKDLQVSCVGSARAPAYGSSLDHRLARLCRFVCDSLASSRSLGRQADVGQRWLVCCAQGQRQHVSA